MKTSLPPCVSLTPYPKESYWANTQHGRTRPELNPDAHGTSSSTPAEMNKSVRETIGITLKTVSALL